MKTLTSIIVMTASPGLLPGADAIAQYTYVNGPPDGSNGYGNGQNRTLLDDFENPVTGRITMLHYYAIWNGGEVGLGVGMDAWIRSDDNGTPGPRLHSLFDIGYEELATGRIFFDRQEYEGWVSYPVGSPVLSPGRYWIEANVIGPQQNFWLIRQNVTGSECWVDYGTLQPGSEMFETPADLAFSVTFDLFCDDFYRVCCLPDGTCIDDVWPCLCMSMNGIPGLPTTCADVECVPFGACCIGFGFCLDQVSAAECQIQQGEFFGPGSTCAEECPLFGACCLLDGTCNQEVTEFECQQLQGDFRGRAVLCADAECPVLGACCHNDGRCIENETSSSCAATAGTFVGAGTRCTEGGGKFVSASVSDGALFGATVAVDGGVVIVGAKRDSEVASHAGSATVYERKEGGAWHESFKIIRPDGMFLDAFGSDVDVDVGDDPGPDDDRLAIGAPYDFSGRVYVYERLADSFIWVEVARLIPHVFASGIGEVIDLDGDTLVAGGRVAGAFVFDRDPETGGWRSVELVAPDVKSGDEFGTAVALSGDTAVVGARRHRHSGFEQGAVYVFERNAGGPGNWGFVAELIPASPTSYDWFGQSLAIQDDTLLVGTPRHDDDRGTVYVYQRSEDPPVWVETTELQASDRAVNDEFGKSVDLDGNMVVVGAWQNDDSCPGDPDCDSGTAYLFVRDLSQPNGWREMSKLFPPSGAAGDHFGEAAAVGGESIAVGAPIDQHASAPGAVYIYDLLACVGCPGDTDFDGDVDHADLLAIIVAWGPCPPGPDCPLDLDGSGAVDFADIRMVLAHWGPCHAGVGKGPLLDE